MSASESVRKILSRLGPETLLMAMRAELGAFELQHHWKQGEFHHDLVFTLGEPLPGDPAAGRCLVVSTNCNGGVKEILCLEDVPDRWALWNERCPENPEFEGALPAVVACERTHHWFVPCLLLTDDARSELRPEARRRQRGGGWVALN